MNRKIRSGLLTLVAAIFALAVVIAPTRAMAEPVTENPVQTDCGTISYIPDENGFNLTVEIYVNDETTPSETIELPKILNNRSGNLSFEPEEGYYYYGGESSYELDAYLESAYWNQMTGMIGFGAESDATKNYDSVLRIYVYTMDRGDSYILDVWSRVRWLEDSPTEVVKGFVLSYEVPNPQGGTRNVTRTITSFENDDLNMNFENQIVPEGVDVTITAICAPGYEVQDWWKTSSPNTSLKGVEGSGEWPGTLYGQAGYGNAAVLSVEDDFAGGTVQLWIEKVESVSDPTNEGISAAGAQVTVDCNNGFAAAHVESTTDLAEGTFSIGAPYAQGDSYLVDATVTPDSYVEGYNAAYPSSTHTLVDGQDQVITFEYISGAFDENGDAVLGHWRPVEGESPLTLQVACDDGPQAPTFDEMKASIGDIVVDCVNEDVTHMDGHYALIEGSYTAAEDALQGSVADGFTYTVTISANKYVEQYTTDTGATHAISGEDSKTVTFVNDGSGWTVQSGTPVGFEVVCETPAPELPTEDELKDILGNEFSVNVNCTNADAQHEGASYGIIPGGVTISDPVKGEDGTYTVLVSFNTNQYIQQYSVDKDYSAHELDGDELQPVTLTWNGSEWTAPNDLADQTLNVKCSEDNTTPVGPTGDEIEALLKGSVVVDCTNSEVEHANKTYDLMGMTYEAGSVTKNADGSYTVEVKVAPGQYVLQFEKDTEGIHHWVAPDGQVGTITLVYVANADGNGGTWQVADGSAPVTFTVICADETGDNTGDNTGDQGNGDNGDNTGDQGNGDNGDNGGNGGNASTGDNNANGDQGNNNQAGSGDNGGDGTDKADGSKLPNAGDATSAGAVAAIALAGVSAAGVALVAHRRQQ
ncbi:MAG TPA: hypothetical protein IAA19_05990 [Candidatus Olsenella pullistercoris]|uniref:Gram-positive cocci surface proteins LPxTG domain-containing protein n=1 Tax=Candidatus Olsenella pullistercoris TaxID=2838712 RepID=A0A9D2JFA5_9ACTN|nr:hypothetical protein [Candidatus Olsenella pullistercoris]